MKFGGKIIFFICLCFLLFTQNIHAEKIKNIQDLWPLLHSRQKAIGVATTSPKSINEFRNNIRSLTDTQPENTGSQYVYPPHFEHYGVVTSWLQNDEGVDQKVEFNHYYKYVRHYSIVPAYYTNILSIIYGDRTVATWQQNDSRLALLEIQQVLQFIDVLCFDVELFDKQVKQTMGWSHESFLEAYHEAQYHYSFEPWHAVTGDCIINGDWGATLRAFWDGDYASINMISMRAKFRLDLTNYTYLKNSIDDIEIYAFCDWFFMDKSFIQPGFYEDVPWDGGNNFINYQGKKLLITNLKLGEVYQSSFYYPTQFNLPDYNLLKYYLEHSISHEVSFGECVWRPKIFGVLKLSDPISTPKPPSKRLYYTGEPQPVIHPTLEPGEDEIPRNKDYIEGPTILAGPGSLYIPETDFEYKGGGADDGVNISFKRTYNSSREMKSNEQIMGDCWWHNHFYKCSYFQNVLGLSDFVTILDEDYNRSKFVKDNDSFFYQHQSKADLPMSSLEEQDNDTLIWTHKYGTKHIFKRNGTTIVFHLYKKIDRNGNYLRYEYDTEGNLTSVTDNTGRKIIFTYQSGNLVSVQDPAGREWKYGYSNGNLTYVEDPLGHREKYYYENSTIPSTITKIEDKRGNELSFEYQIRTSVELQGELSDPSAIIYDSYGRVSKITDALGNECIIDNGDPDSLIQQDITVTKMNGQSETYSFDDEGRCVKRDIAGVGYEEYGWDDYNNVTSYRDYNGNVRQFTFDEEWRDVLTETNALNGVIERQYDSTYRKKIYQKDTLGRETEWDLGSAGNIVSETDPLDNSITYTYDSAGRVLTETDKEGNTTTYEYSYYGHMKRKTDPEEGIWRFSYDVVGNKTAEVDPEGHVTYYLYDDLNRVTRITNPDLTTKLYAYDNEGNLASETDENGNVTEYEYDALNRLVKKIDALNGETSYTYNAMGSLISETDANSNTTYYAYDGVNRLIKKTDAEGYFERYEYSGDCGNPEVVGGKAKPTKITDKRGKITEKTYDALYRLVEEEDPLDYTKTYDYDNEGNLISETDKNNNITTHEYDDLDRLTKTTLPGSEGYTIEYTYDKNSNKKTEKDANNHVTTYEYDGNNRVEKVTDALSGEKKYEYDKNSNVLKEIDQRNKVKVYTYDFRNRKKTETDPLGNTISYDYDGVGNEIKITDARGNITEKTYDALNRLTEIKDALNYTVTYEYDPVGNKLSEIDQNNHTTSYTYNSRNLLTELKDPLNGKFIYSYDEAGNKVSETDKRGNVTSFSYTDRNELHIATDPHTETITYTYDGNGNKATETDQNNHTTSYTYDARNNLTKTTDELNGEISSTYDGVGNKLSEKNQNTLTTNYTYDAINRLTQTKDPLDHTTINAYDAVGNLISITDANGKVTSYTYDDASRLIKVTNAEGGEIHYSYDANGNKTSTSTPEGSVTTYEYDLLNRLTKTISPLGFETLYTYDGIGNRASQTDPNGNKITYLYDVLNRLKKRTFSDDSFVEYFYDNDSNRTGMTDPTGSYTYSFDELSRITGVSGPTGSITYGYDAVGNRTQMVSPAGSINYEYDSLNRLEKITDNDSGETIYSYDAASRITRQTYPHGIYTDYAYDDADRTTAIATKDNDGSVIRSIAYTYDNVGNKLTQTDTEGVAEYTYDDVYRVTLVEYPDGTTESYTYDQNGNRISKTNSVSGAGYYTYDLENRLISESNSSSGTYTTTVTGNINDVNIAFVQVNGVDAELDNGQFSAEIEIRSNDGVVAVTAVDLAGNYTRKEIVTYFVDGTKYYYDSNGNLIKKTMGGSDTIYGYDYENRLVSASLPDGSAVSFTYDGDKRRVSKTVNGSTEKFLYDGINILADLDSSNAILTEYIQGIGIDSLIRSKDNDGVSYYHADSLGSTRFMTNPAKNIIQSYNYDIWGKIRSSTGSSSNEYTYTGRRDESELGLMFYRARMYDPNIGRFIQKDPLTGGPDDPSISYKNNIYAFFDRAIQENINSLDPHNTNRYVYCGSNPINYIDPLGLWKWDNDWIQKGVGGVLGFYGKDPVDEALSPIIKPTIRRAILNSNPAGRLWLSIEDGIEQFNKLKNRYNVQRGGGAGKTEAIINSLIIEINDYTGGKNIVESISGISLENGQELSKIERISELFIGIGKVASLSASVGNKIDSVPPVTKNNNVNKIVDEYTSNSRYLWKPGNIKKDIMSRLENHWSDRKKQGVFKHIKNARQYANEAHEFMKYPPKGTLIKKRNNDLLYYHNETNRFGVWENSLGPATYFKPFHNRPHFKARNYFIKQDGDLLGIVK